MYDLDLKRVRELDALLGHLLEQGLVAPMEPAWDHSWGLRAKHSARDLGWWKDLLSLRYCLPLLLVVS